MTTTTPVATREAVNRALNLHWWDEDDQPCACGFDFIAAGQSFKMHLTDGLLAAGVFREPPTLEQIMKALDIPFSQNKALTLDGAYRVRLNEWVRDYFAAAVLTLLDGTDR